ncbi:extracellular matrix-binding protein ebh-like isoform X2 [Saccostrea cucullata]|uniref:extracellular matrix-binding protein ebh-like isoform X2 n=1 Tax=Saccostrea cuccullata TaxID=36930 RepID=UPI002ED58352
MALDKVILENDQLQKKIQESKLTELEAAVKKREELIVQLSSALQTVTNQAPTDTIATEMAQEVQHLKNQLQNASKLLEVQSEKYNSTTQTLQEAKAEIAVLQKNLRERDKGHQVIGSPATNQEALQQGHDPRSSAANQEELSQLQHELQEAKTQIATLQKLTRETGSDEITTQNQGQLEALQEVVRSKDNQIAELQSTVSQSESESEKLKNNVRNLESSLSELNDLKQINEKLKSDIENMEEQSLVEVQQLRNENVELKDNVKSLNEKNAKETECLKIENHELKLQIIDLEENVKVTEEVKVKDEMVAKEAEELKMKVKELENQLKLTKETADSDSGELDLLKADYELLTDTLKLKNERILELEEALTESKHEIEMELLRGDNERLSEEVIQLEEKLESSEKNIAEKGRRLESFCVERDMLVASLEEKDEQLSMQESNIVELQREKEQQALELDQLNEDLENALLKCKRSEDLELQLEAIVSQLDSIQQECQCYRIQNDELKNRINVQQDLYLSQQYQIEVAGSEKEKLLQENLRLGSEKEELTSEIQRLTEEVENFSKKDLDELEFERNENQESMEKSVSKIHDLETTVQHLKEENSAFKTKVQTLEDHILRLQKDLQNSQDEKWAEIDQLHDSYKQELLDKDDVINTLQAEIHVYKESKSPSPDVKKPKDWETSEKEGDDSITEFMLESVVEDLLCQSEAAIEKEAKHQKETTTQKEVGISSEKLCEEMEFVQEEFVQASHVNLFSVEKSDKFGQNKSDDVDNEDSTNSLEQSAILISQYEEEISKLNESLVAHKQLEDVKEKTLQSVLSELESMKEEKSQDESAIRSVLNLDPDISLDSENFLKILRTLENQKCHLLEKLEKAEAEKEKLLKRIQNTETDNISCDSLNLEDSIDEENVESKMESQPEEMEDMMVDDEEDGVDGAQNTEMMQIVEEMALPEDTMQEPVILSTSVPDTDLTSERGPSPADRARSTADSTHSESGDIKVSPCMLSSDAAASVIVHELTNSSSVVHVSVENVSVQSPPSVSTGIGSDGVSGNFHVNPDGENRNDNVDLPDTIIALNKTVAGEFSEDVKCEMEKQISVLASEKESLQLKIKSVMEDLDKKSCECKDFRDKLNQVSNQFDVFKASFSDITIKNENLEYDNEELKEKLETLQKELNDVKCDYSSLQDHYDMVGDENHTLKYEHDQLLQKYETVVSENSSLLESLSDSEVMGSKILKESEDIVQRLSELEEDNSKLRERLDQSTNEKLAMETEIEDLIKKLQRVNSDNENLLVEKSELVENHRKLINEMNIVEKEKLENFRKIQTLQQKLEEQKQASQEVRNTKISELESVIDELRGQNRILSFNIQSAEMRIQKQLEEDDEIKKRHQEDVKMKDAEIQKIREEQRSLWSSVQEKDSELHKMGEILKDFENKNHQLNKDMEALQEIKQELTDKLVRLEEKLEAKENELESVQKQCMDLTETWKDAQIKNEELKIKFAELEGKLEAEVKEKISAQKESQDLMESLEVKEKLVKEMELKCEGLLQQISENGEKMKSTEKHLQSREDEIKNLLSLSEDSAKKLEEECSLKSSEIERLAVLVEETKYASHEQNEKHKIDILNREQEIQQIQQELKEKSEKVLNLEQEMQHQAEKAKDEEIQVKELKQIISNLEKEMGNVESRNVEMSTTKDREVCYLQQKLKDSELQVKTLQLKMSTLEELNSEMVKKLEEMEQKCKTLKTELRKEVESRLEEKHYQIQQLRDDIGDLKENIGNRTPQEEVEKDSNVLESLGKLESSLSKIKSDMALTAGLSESESEMKVDESELQLIVTEEKSIPEKTTAGTGKQAVSTECSNDKARVSTRVENLELKKTVDRLMTTVQELEKDKNYLKICLKEARQGLRKGEEEDLEVLMEENSQLMEENKVLTKELEKLTSEAAARNTCNAEDMTKESDFVEDNAELQKEMERKVELLSSENVRLKKDFSDLQDEIERGQSQIMQITSLFQQSVSSNEVLKNEILSLKDELESIAETRESVDEALSSVEQKIKEDDISGKREIQLQEESPKVKQISELLVSLTLANSMNIVLKEENETLRNQLLEKETSLEELTHRCQENEDKANEIQENARMLEKEIENVKRNSSTYEKDLNEKEQIIHVLEKKLKIVTTENTEMREERETIIEEVKVHRGITTEMRDSVERSRQDVVNIRKEQSQFKSKMDEIIVEKEKLARDLLKKVVEIKELRAKIGVLSEENDQLKQTQERFEKVKAERDELISIQEKLLEDLTEMQGRYESVHALMEETKQECNNEMEKLREQLGSVNRDVGGLKLSIDILQSELQSAQEQRDQLMTSLEEKDHLLVVTEKERQKELNDKFNKELQNQRRAGGGSQGVESEVFGESMIQNSLSGGSHDVENLVVENDLIEDSVIPQTVSESCSVDTEFMNQRSGSENLNLGDETSQSNDQNFESEERVDHTTESEGRTDVGADNILDSEKLREAEQLRNTPEEDLNIAGGSVVEESNRTEGSDVIPEEGISETVIKQSDKEPKDFNLEEERENIRKGLSEEYERQIEGMRYEMEEKLEMSLKDHEYELLGKFDMEKRDLVKQMEQAVAQKIESVKAEKHKEFVEAMQKVRKDHGKKLKAEVEKRKAGIQQKFQKQFQEVCEERDKLMNEIQQMKQGLNPALDDAADDSVFREQDRGHNSIFISEDVSPDSSLDLHQGQEWSCRKSDCQKLYQNFKDLLDRTANIGFDAPGSGKSDVVMEDTIVEQGFKPELIDVNSGGDGLQNREKNLRLDSLRRRGSEFLNEQGLDCLKVSVNEVQSIELKQGFQPEPTDVRSESELDGAYGGMEQGFNPEDSEYLKDIRDEDLQASRLSLNLDTSREERNIQRSFSAEPPQFSPGERKRVVFPLSAPVQYFRTDTDEGFIPSENQQDQPDSTEYFGISETELSDMERTHLEKLLKVKDFFEEKIKKAMDEFSREKSELLERCQMLNTKIENEILLRQGLEQELNSLVEDIPSAGSKNKIGSLMPSAEMEVNTDESGDRERTEVKVKADSSAAKDAMENKLKGLTFLYEKEKKLKDILEEKLNEEKLYRKLLEEELKSQKEDTAVPAPLSAGLPFSGRHGSGLSRNGRPFVQRQFSYEAEDAGNRVGDTWSALRLFSNEHYKEMESRVNQLELQKTFLTEKIRIVESLNNSERKALVEKIRKLESELSELRQGSVFVEEEEEEMVVEGGSSRRNSVPDFMTEEGVEQIEAQTKEDTASGTGDESFGIVRDQDKMKTSVKDISAPLNKQDQNIKATEEFFSKEAKVEEFESDIVKLTETLNSCQKEMEILKRDNLSLQLEMKEKDDFMDHVESKTKELVFQLKKKKEENDENKLKNKALSDECVSQERINKELLRETSALKDNLIEEKMVIEALQKEMEELRDRRVSIARSDKDCQADFSKDQPSGDMKTGSTQTQFVRDKQSKGTHVEVKTIDTDAQTDSSQIISESEETKSDTEREQVYRERETRTDSHVRVEKAEKEVQTAVCAILIENKQTQTKKDMNQEDSLKLQRELSSIKTDLKKKEDYIKKLEDELDQVDSPEREDIQDFQEYQDKMEKTLKEKETYIRKLEEHLLGRQTPERNLKSLQQKLSLDPPQVECSEDVEEDLLEEENTTPRGNEEENQFEEEVGERSDVKPLLPWRSPLDDESSYSVRSTSHLEISTNVPESIPEASDLFSPSGSSVCSGSGASTFSGGSWDCRGEPIVSGLGPDEDGHKALENKHFELIDEISNLRKDLSDTKSIYTQESALLQEALEREKWMSGSLRSKLGMSNTVVNFNLSAELVSMRQKVSVLQETNKMLQMENDKWLKRVQEQERLVMELKGQLGSSEELVEREKDELFTQQVALLQQQRQELIDKLKERELENNKLSSKIGDQMILEENLRREKDLLKVKLSERESIEKELSEKKMELQRQIGYQRKLEDIIYHKNLIEKELMRQKRLLEMDFLEIEAKLQEKEELLEIQRNQLLRELKMKDQILAFGSGGRSELTTVRSRFMPSGSRVQSPAVSESSSGGPVSSMSDHFNANVSRSSDREAGRIHVMLTDAEKEHINAIEFLKGKLKTGTEQNLQPRSSKSTTESKQQSSGSSDRTASLEMLSHGEATSSDWAPTQRSESERNLHRKDT